MYEVQESGPDALSGAPVSVPGFPRPAPGAAAAAMTAPCAAARPGYVPRHAALDLAPLPTAVPCARLHARHVLREWGLAALADDAELVVSELVTNAVAAAAGITGPDGSVAPVRLRLTGRPRGVQLEVWDAAGGMPAARDAGPDDEGGRGLVLVAALAARYGAYATEGGGKCTYAVLGE